MYMEDYPVLYTATTTNSEQTLKNSFVLKRTCVHVGTGELATSLIHI